MFSFDKRSASWLVLLAIALAGQADGASLSLSQVPLFLTEGVAPNIMVTLDNSNSMRWAFAPDGMNPNSGVKYGGYTADEIRTSRRAKSAVYNPLYYNPDTTYTAPYSVTYSGSKMVYTPLTTSFTTAYVNGFIQGKGSLDLSSGYKVTWEYDTSRTAATASSYTSYSAYNSPDKVYYLAANPSADFGASTTTSTAAGTSSVTSNYTYSSNASTCPSSINSSSSTTSSNSTSTTDGVTTTTNTSTTTVVSYSNIACTRSGSRYTVTATRTSSPTTTTTVTTAARTTAGVPAYYYVYNSAANGCTASIQDDNCYTLVTVSSTSGPNGSDERQNFANWYSFYRNRQLATQSAANLAFSSLSENTRLSWQALGTDATCITSSSYLSSYNCRGLVNSSTTYYDNRLRNFSGAHRAKFFEWLGDIYFNQGTPLLAAVDRVGSLLSATGVNGPYAYSLGSTEKPIYACRASYSITMTDGIWNTAGSHGEYDNASQSLPDGQVYSPRAPYKDSAKNTLADLAFKYWATDAQTGLANEVPAYIQEANSNATSQYWNPKNDPATWQHMVSYFVGLGLTNSLTSPSWGGDTYSGDYDALVAGNKSWPAASAGSDNNVYDLWHAAINSRGEFFSADSPDSLVSALQEVVNRISAQTAAAAGPALTSPLLDGDGSNAYDTYSYTPKFSSEDWSGDLIKYQQNTAAGSKTQQWSAQSILDGVYASGNSAYSARVVKMANAKGNLQDFTWSNLTTAQQTALNKTLASVTDSNGSKRVDYLRGDRSNEGTVFRTRSHVLGDIVDSSPAIVRAPSRLASRMNAAEGQSAADANSYTHFKSTYASRETRIYVGANDGMLHAFDEDGNETFAFIPSAVLGNLYKLSDSSYTGSAHQYYVDGSPTEADVYFDGAWHSVLIGSLRGGGRGLFALDVTNPDDIKLLWEISASDSAYAQLGYTYAKPAVARLADGNWAVVAGNGYNSDGDKAVLYLIDVADGSLLKAITPSTGSSANGMAAPYAADVDGDQIADYIYAGDLLGNLWRVDVLGSSTASYGVSFGGSPLYSALSSGGTVQPITTRPYLAKHPSGSGYIVVFGTGKYIENDDAEPNTAVTQTLYGIWDSAATSGSTKSSTPSLSRSKLVAQTIESESAATFSNNGTTVTANVRTVSDNTVQWVNNSGDPYQYGWYLDLKTGSTSSGEMVVTNPYVSNDLLIVATLTPNEDPCADGVTTWLMALDPYTGGATSYAAIDLNNDGVVDSADMELMEMILSGTEMDGLTGGFTVTQDADGNLVVCGSDGCKTLTSSSGSSGRQSWRAVQGKE